MNPTNQCCDKCSWKPVASGGSGPPSLCNNPGCECHVIAGIKSCKHHDTASFVKGFGWKCDICGEVSGNHGGSPGTNELIMPYSPPTPQSSQEWEKQLQVKWNLIVDDTIIKMPNKESYMISTSFRVLAFKELLPHIRNLLAQKDQGWVKS